MFTVHYCNFTLHHIGLKDNLAEVEEGPTLQQQEVANCSMVIANNAIRLKEIQSAVIEDNNVFGNIESVSVATIDRVLKIA